MVQRYRPTRLHRSAACTASDRPSGEFVLRGLLCSSLGAAAESRNLWWKNHGGTWRNIITPYNFLWTSETLNQPSEKETPPCWWTRLYPLSPHDCCWAGLSARVSMFAFSWPWPPNIPKGSNWNANSWQAWKLLRKKVLRPIPPSSAKKTSITSLACFSSSPSYTVLLHV